MDFLRRLHPAHAEGAGAARLDLPPRWAFAAPLATPTPRAVGAAQPDDVRDALTPQPTQRATPRHEPGAAPRGATAPPPAAAVAASPPRARDTLPAAQDRGSERRDRPVAATPPAPFSVAPAPAATTGAEAGPRATGTAVAAPVAPLATGIAQRREPSLRPPALQPLRAQTLLQQARRAPQESAAPVVHVSIDRIDVRLPSVPVAPARKPRAASAVAPLADYLRAAKGPR